MIKLNEEQLDKILNIINSRLHGNSRIGYSFVEFTGYVDLLIFMEQEGRKRVIVRAPAETKEKSIERAIIDIIGSGISNLGKNIFKIDNKYF